MDNLEHKIEAILFFKGEPVSIKKISEFLNIEKEQVEEAVLNLKTNLTGRGIVLMENNGEISLGTSPHFAQLIESLQKEDLNKELSKSSLETLSVILYKNGVSRAEIDHIRGVNSSFTLRALCIRGLIEKIVDPTDSRKYLYRPTTEMLSYLGITSIHELPEYNQVIAGLSQVEKSFEDSDSES